MRRKKAEKIIIEEPIIKETSVEVEAEPTFCVVSTGDSISDVARKFNTTEEEIRKLNNITDIVGGNVIRVK